MNAFAHVDTLPQWRKMKHFFASYRHWGWKMDTLQQGYIGEYMGYTPYTF